MLVGASVSLAANVDNTCVASIAKIFESTYSVYYYLGEYQEYEEDEDLAWAFTYVITISNVLSDFDCTDGLTT